MTASRKIRIGPAGWSYKDWEGIVYAQKPGAKFDPLEYLAKFFDAIEMLAPAPLFNEYPALADSATPAVAMSENEPRLFS